MKSTTAIIVPISAINLGVFALTFSIVFTGSSANAQVTRPALRTVVHSDHSVAGLPADVRISQEGNVYYYGLGGSSVAFAADLAAAEPNHAIWYQDTANQTRFLIRSADSAPGLPAGTYFSEGLWYLTLNSVGDVAFTGNTLGAVNGRGIWARRSGSIDVVAATGQSVPGMPGRVFQTAELSSINDAGQVALSAWIAPISGTGPGTPGIWSEGGGAGIQLLAAVGLPAPTIPGATFSNVGHPYINRHGQAAFFASLLRSPLDRGGIWTGHDYNDIHPLVLYEDPYNALPGGFFSFIGSNPNIDSSGAVFFNANVYSPSTGVVSGVWKATDAGLQEIVRQDTIQPYPNNPNIIFTGIGQAVVSDNGAIAFSGGITGPGVHYLDSNEGIWLRSPDGQVMLIAREGDPLPDGPPEEQYRFFPEPEPTINNRGQVAFDTYFYRPGQVPYIGSAIFATDTSGQLQTIVRTGDVIDVDSGPAIDLRTIENIGFFSSGNNNGGFTSAFNDQGELLFQARFTDGSLGFLVSNLVAIPEPSIAAFLATTAFAFLCRRNCSSSRPR